MEYTLMSPCDACPFLSSSGFSRKQLYAHANGEFACHKTCVYNDETGHYEPVDKSVHCAGALIFLEKRKAPHQMMRICNRLGFYDPSKLDMKANVQ